MRLPVAVIAVLGILSLAACQDAPKKPAAAATARAAAPPKYIETGSRVPTDHPQVYPDLGVMSQSALQDAIGDHTGPGYNQTGPNPSPQ
jgi:hypothetical protein